MTNFKLLTLVFIISLTACTKKAPVKSYKYIEISEVKGLFGGITYKEKEAVIITALSDSAAYCKAYEKFCIVRKVFYTMAKEYPESIGSGLTKPLSFKLLTESGENIENSVHFTDKEIIEIKIEAKIQAIKIDLPKNK